jgi:large subunit ribosomal protein L24
MAHTTKIKKGDTVLVIAGKDKGSTGKVISVDRAKSRVLVEGVASVKRHTQESTNERGVKVGGILTKESAIHISNVMVVDADGTATRIGSRKDEDGKNVRISRRSGKDL